jgi:hypothetical protein
MGGVGLLSTALVLPLMGSVYENKIDNATQVLKSTGFDTVENAAKIQLLAGADTLRYFSIMPAILIVAFTILYLLQRKKRLKDASTQTNHSGSAAPQL